MKHEKPRDDATPRRIMTATEVADYLNVHKGTIYRMARIGKIPAFKIGDDWRFDKDAIDKWTTGRTSEVLKKRSAAVRVAAPARHAARQDAVPDRVRQDSPEAQRSSAPGSGSGEPRSQLRPGGRESHLGR